MKIGSLCSGYGGLDMAVEAYFDAETIWMCDNDKYASVVIKERWGLPNLGNLKEVDWTTVEPIDILTAGYPCQPFSNAGQRKGLNDDRHIWPNIKEIISTLRPSIVILENVRGHLSLGFKEVLQDFTQIGYDAKWQIVRASDAGAPHRRERLFVFAQPTNSNNCPDSELRRIQRSIRQESSQQFNRADRNEFRTSGETISNADTEQLQADGQAQGLGRRFETPFELSMRRTPNPLDQSKLNTRFVEYMMGLQEGWVTDLDLSRAQQFKLLGNGVVPQQAYYALELLDA
jgi:DNA (cytosine-5)-methyltransferase 1